MEIHHSEERFFSRRGVGSVRVAEVFARKTNELAGVIEVGFQVEDDLGTFEVVGNFVDANSGFLVDGLLKPLLQLVGSPEAIHDGGRHPVGGIDATGAVAVEPEFLVSFDAGGEGEDEGEKWEEKAGGHMRIAGSWSGDRLREDARNVEGEIFALLRAIFRRCSRASFHRAGTIPCRPMPRRR